MKIAERFTYIREDVRGNVFVESMGELFAETVSDEELALILALPSCECCARVREDGCLACSTTSCSACIDPDCQCCGPTADTYTILEMPRVLAEMLEIDEDDEDDVPA